jgi:hypothetical protein
MTRSDGAVPIIDADRAAQPGDDGILRRIGRFVR